ncbi:hypothetical protein WMF31_29570 [Sorangium sp. So ce1036]|uniref:hypothetical protein n=1 Tax=Sorangium sp. So ce1036 TaxID=3133328 RepID=UPI003F0547CB
MGEDRAAAAAAAARRAAQRRVAAGAPSARRVAAAAAPLAGRSRATPAARHAFPPDLGEASTLAGCAGRARRAVFPTAPVLAPSAVLRARAAQARVAGVYGRQRLAVLAIAVWITVDAVFQCEQHPEDMRHGLSGTTRALVLCGCACALLVVPAPARAFELSGGVSVGGLQIGTGPRLALSPFGGLLWRWEREFLLEVHNMSSVVPGARAGVYDRTAASLVYAWKTGKVSLGPSFSIYAMPVCGIKSCNRVVGVAPGGHAQTDWYFSEPLGVSVSANLDGCSSHTDARITSGSR